LPITELWILFWGLIYYYKVKKREVFRNIGTCLQNTLLAKIFSEILKVKSL